MMQTNQQMFQPFSPREVLDALKYIFDHYNDETKTNGKKLDVQQFLRNHGIRTHKIKVISKEQLETFCSQSVKLLQAVLEEEDFERFDDIFELLFGPGQQWKVNWQCIAKDLLDWKHFLEFEGYYLSKEVLFLQENLSLQTCEASNQGSSSSFNDGMSLCDAARKRFEEGGHVFAENNMKISVVSDVFDCWAMESFSPFFRDRDLDRWGYAQFQGKSVTLSDLGILQPLQQDNLAHINLDVVKFILKEFFAPNGYGVFEQPNGTYKLCLNIANIADPSKLKCILLASYTQNGKTNQMIALVWILFFCHGYGSYLLCRSDSQEYAVLENAIKEFNERFLEWAAHKPQFNYLRSKLFTIRPKTLAQLTLKQLQKESVEDDEGNLLCICRIRILQASNILRANDEIEYMNQCMQNFGVSAEGSNRHKYCVLIDEAQNVHQTLDQKLRLEQSIKSLLKKVAICIEVSATQEGAFVMRSEQAVQMLFIPAKPDYFGYSSHLPQNRRITISKIDDFLGTFEGKNVSTAQAMVNFAAEGLARAIVLSEDNETFTSPKHWLCVTATNSNTHLLEMGLELLDNLKKLQSNHPVIVVISVANISVGPYGNNKGSRILFNHSALGSLTSEDIRAVDGQFFVAESDLNYLPDNIKGEFNSKKKGAHIVINGQTKIKLSCRCPEDLDFKPRSFPSHTEDVVGYELSLPRVGGYYRLRTQLSMVEELMKRKNCQKYSVITIGGRLLKEGITPKTVNHTLAPEKMFCLFPYRGFPSRTVIALIQTMGRLCGPRNDGVRPELYMREDCLVGFSRSINFNDYAMRLVNKFQHRPTVHEIMTTKLEEAKNPDNPLIKSVFAQDIWEQIELPHTIMAMRRFFLAQFTSDDDQSNFDFQKDIKGMVNLLLYMKEESLDDDQMDDWYYRKDFECVGKKEAERLIKLFFENDVEDWVDRSLEDYESEFPVGVRHFPNQSADERIGIRLQNGSWDIDDGLVVCTCHNLCAQPVTLDCSFTRCSSCKLHYHDVCQPCLTHTVRNNESTFCSRCQNSVERASKRNRQAVQDSSGTDSESVHMDTDESDSNGDESIQPKKSRFLIDDENDGDSTEFRSFSRHLMSNSLPVLPTSPTAFPNNPEIVCIDLT